MDKLVYKDLSYKIRGFLYEVHNELGRYRNEKQYADCFEALLKREKIEYDREYRFEDHQYSKGTVRCIVDFIIEGKVIVEFKAKDIVTKEDYFQVRRYLTTLNLHLGL